MVLELQKGGHEIDQKLADGRIQLFKDSQPANVVSSPTGDSASSSESDDTEGKTLGRTLLERLGSLKNNPL